MPSQNKSQRTSRNLLLCVALSLPALASCLKQKAAPVTPASSGAQSRAADEIDPDTIFEARLCVLDRPVDRLQDVTRCPALGTVESHFNVPPQHFKQGFRGITKENEWFALDFAGVFTTTMAGEHRFRLKTDDHAMLWIDGRLVLENGPPRSRRADREPQVTTAELTLEAREHRFRLLYLHGRSRRLALMLHVTSPNQSERVFSTKL